MQCFSEFTTNIYQYKFYYIVLPSASSPTMTMKEITIEMILKSGMEADATWGKEKLLKNFIYNAFVWKYPSSVIQKLKDMSKISIKI